MRDWLKGRYLWIREAREESGTIIVIKKQCGNAVRRNRLRRRLRHINAQRNNTSKNFVVFARPEAVRACFLCIKEEMGRLIDEIAGT